jgi:hypothetical protein
MAAEKAPRCQRFPNGNFPKLSSAALFPAAPSTEQATMVRAVLIKLTGHYYALVSIGGVDVNQADT